MIAGILSRIWPHLLGGAAIIFAVWWIYSSGQEAERVATEARNAAQEKKLNERLDKFKSDLIDKISNIDTSVAGQIGKIDITERTIIRPRLEREIVREARFSDPSLGLSDGLLAAINAARDQSACPTAADGSVECSLPPATPSN